MIRRGKPSDWKWSTSASTSFSAAVITKGEGHFVLTAPRGGDVRFNYEFVGVCKGFGADIGVSGSTEDLESVGTLYMSDTFSGTELASDDLEGFCLIDDATAVFGGMLPAGAAGGSVTAMILGIPWQNVPTEIVEDQGALGISLAFFSDHPWAAGPLGGAFFDEAGDSLNELLSTHASALLLMRGEAIGTGTSVGISASIGRVWTKTRSKRDAAT